MLPAQNFWRRVERSAAARQVMPGLRLGFDFLRATLFTPLDPFGRMAPAVSKSCSLRAIDGLLNWP